MKADWGDRLDILRLWFFAYSGFTEDAESLMQAEGVLWSDDHQDLNSLLACTGLRRLPKI